MTPPLARCFAAVFLVAAIGYVQSLCPGHEDACDRKKIIGNAESRGISVIRSTHVAYCDSHFDGWYQFKHSNGTTVLTIPSAKSETFNCHPRKLCGTEIPITLRYKKTQNNGLTVYDGCFDYVQCCLFKIEVCSKECENGIVYYLSSPFGCPIAYCTNYTAPCAANQYRDEDSNQCLDEFPMILSKNPTITVDPNSVEDTINFTCTVFLDETDRERGPTYEVQWIKNDKYVPSRFDMNISYTGEWMKKIIYSIKANAKNTVPFTLKCRVRSFYKESRGRRSEWFCSNAFYAGLSVYPSSLEIFENSTEPVEIHVQPTIPIICSSKEKDSHPGKNCVLTVQIQHTKLMYQAPSACRHSFTKHNWNKVKSFTLNAVPDMINSQENNPLIILVKMLKKLAINDEDQDNFPSQWFAHEPTPILVNVRDAPGIECRSVNDPRTFTFDDTYFFYYGTGDFLLAKSAVNDLEVQIRLWHCNDAFNANSLFSCNCGVAIREGNNVVSVGQCVVPSLQQSRLLQVVRNSNSTFSNGFRVFKYKKNNQVRVVLSTGSFVDIFGDHHGVNVYLRLSPIYANKTEGLCGNSNGLSEDDLIGRDGVLHGERDERGFANFSETWRLNSSNSFFEKVGLTFQSTETEPTDVSNVLKFCQCENFTNTGNSSACHSDEISDIVTRPFYYGEFDQFDLITEEDVEFTQMAAILANPRPTRKRRLAEQLALNKRAANHYGWPTKSNITKEMAEEQCQNGLEESFAALACKQEGFIREVDPKTIRACVEDIKATDDLSWPRSYVRMVQAQCEDAILENSSYWKEQFTPNTNNQSSSTNASDSLADDLPVFPKSVQSSFCPNNCSGRGSCENSKCVCPKGFAGEDCLVVMAKPPQASHFNTGPLCDVNGQPCTTLHVIGNGFYDHPSLACVIRVQGSRRVLKIRAKYQSMIDLTCRIPNNIFRQNGTTYVQLAVKVSVRKNVSNEELRYIVYNSTCYKCNEDANCYLKSGMCNIKRKCIGPNDVLESEGHCKTCESSYSTSKWKVTKKRELCPKLTNTDNCFVRITTFGSDLKATYRCLNGCLNGCFALVGERSRTCNLTNACNRPVRWSGNPPTCTSTICRKSNSQKLGNRIIAFFYKQKANCTENLSVSKCGMTADLLQVSAKCDNKTLEENYSCTDSNWTLVNRTFTCYLK